MPELYTTEVRADQLRVNQDRVIDNNGDCHLVLSRSSKTKWTTVEFHDWASIKVENDFVIKVERERPTPEEQAAADLRTQLLFLDLREQRAIKEFADAKRRVADAVAADDWNIDGRLQDLLIAKASFQLWMRVQQTHLNHATAPNLEPITRLEAYARVAGRVREELIEFANWASRSTSTWHNAVEDIERDVKSRFLRDAVAG